MNGSEDAATPTKVAAFLKSVYLPVPHTGEKAAELMWVTTTLTTPSEDDNIPRCKAWDTEASLVVTIDVLDNITRVRHPALEAHTALAARGLLSVVACAIQHPAHTFGDEESALDPRVLEDLVESFSFSDIKKRSLAAKYCTFLCDTFSDKTALL